MRCERGAPVAVETIGNCYWITNEIEAAGMVPRLVHAGEARAMSGSANKTDKLDVRGINRLQRSGTLPTVWNPPRELRRCSWAATDTNGPRRAANQDQDRVHTNLST